MAIVDNQETNNYPKGISGSIPPPGFTPRAASVVPFTRLNSLFNQMTTGEDGGQFKSMISKLHNRQILAMASLLTSDSDYFTAIVGNKNGSVRVQTLFGKSDDVDSLLCAAILRSFFKIMTDRCASHVAVRAMEVFDSEKKKAMYEHTRSI
ncbi:unnamed protein product [Arabis nemorensis]|uniref:PUM-HD domain-containing protein n=1 Tax=Arabis nemorensis TaxID=586526 RepID=A0A565CSW3_9BRAS|nr:unnamed protein product [Arabis nemorensis]